MAEADQGLMRIGGLLVSEMDAMSSDRDSKSVSTLQHIRTSVGGLGGVGL